MLRTPRYRALHGNYPKSLKVLLAAFCILYVVAPIFGQPKTATSNTPIPTSQPAAITKPPLTQRETRINDLAFRIATAASEAKADAFFRAETELAGVELGRALLLETFKMRDMKAAGETILTVNLRLLRYTKRPNMAAARGLAHRGLGIAYANLGRWDLVENELLTAIELFRGAKAAGLQDVVLTSRDMAWAYFRRGYYAKALEQYEQVRILAAECDDKDSIIQAHTGMAAVFLTQGRRVEAVAAYDSAYRTAIESGSPASVSYLFQSALAKIKLGDLSGAFSRFRKVQAESSAAADRRLYIYSLLNIAWIYKQDGQDKKAVEIYKRAISLADTEIASSVENIRRSYVAAKVEAGNRLAEIYTERGDSRAALDVYASNLKMLQSGSNPKVQAGSQDANSILEIGTNLSVGELHASLGNNSEASSNFAAALTLAEKIGYETGSIDTLLSLATHAARLGDPQKAFSYVDKTNLLVQRSGRLDQLLKLRTITAGVQRKLNRPGAADLSYQEAVRISESLRTDVTMPDQRAAYFSSLFAPFIEYIDFLMERHEKEPDAGFDAKAFNVSERRRARALLDSLKVARIDIRHGVDAALLDQENRIRNQLNSVAREQFSTIDPQLTPAIDDDRIDSRVSSPRSDIALLTAELARVETAIRNKSPRYAELMQPRPLRSGGIQTLLDEKTILLNYTLGEKRSFLWTITQAGVNSFILPPRADIEALVKTVYSELSDSPTGDEPGAQFSPAAEALAGMLIAPAAGPIGNKKIVIVADGALQYLPFSSLPDPRTLSTTKRPMLSSNEIQFAPSGSVVAVLRQEAERRPPPPSAVAIFADPVFSVADERFEERSAVRPSGTPAIEESLTRDLFDPRLLSWRNKSGAYEIPRLPFSRREADSIFINAPAGSSFKALDFEASRENVASIDLSKYGIVHFATHGILHSEYPELSGVVLSMFNQKAEPVDGFLRLNEIYNMKLNADLVVLSACQTALGKEVRGEGLIGLTRGFMYAGSPRVVASLWKVDDVATAELMKIFYQKLFKENMRPASALRGAKIEMMQQKRWSSPYYWAAFELQGEWR